jgi:hypothetical protein
MKTQYSAKLTNHPDSRIEVDVNVAGGYIPTHKELAEGAAIDAAQSHAEPTAEAWTYDASIESTVAIMPDGTRKPYEFVAVIQGPSAYTAEEQSTWSDDDERWEKDGDEWDTEFSGYVLINGEEHAVEVW